MGKLHVKIKIQVSKAMFLSKYGNLGLYNEYMKKDLSLTTKNYNLIKNGWTLIGITEK